MRDAGRVAALAGLALAVACTPREEMPGADEGARIFAGNCAVCHGAGGSGGVTIDGSRPPALTGIAARNGGDFPRAKMLSQIDGYGRGLHPGRAMPEFGALLEGDTVPVDIDGTMTPTPRPLAALLYYLESIQED